MQKLKSWGMWIAVPTFLFTTSFTIMHYMGYTKGTPAGLFGAPAYDAESLAQMISAIIAAGSILIRALWKFVPEGWRGIATVIVDEIKKQESETPSPGIKDLQLAVALLKKQLEDIQKLLEKRP